MVGDQGTNKIVRSVKEKSSVAYGWAVEVPTDMHARGNDIMDIHVILHWPLVIRQIK